MYKWKLHTCKIYEHYKRAILWQVAPPRPYVVTEKCLIFPGTHDLNETFQWNSWLFRANTTRVYAFVFTYILINICQNQCLYPCGICTKKSAVSLKSIIWTMPARENSATLCYYIGPRWQHQSHYCTVNVDFVKARLNVWISVDRFCDFWPITLFVFIFWK